MPNPFYQQLMGGGVSQAGVPSPSVPMFANPMQKMMYMMQAMTNPAAFVRQHFPDIPDQIQYDPGQILNYLRQTRGISDEQMRRVQQQAGSVVGQGTVR